MELLHQLWTSFDQIRNFAKGKIIALLLEYDGTSSPIVDIF